MKINEFLSNVNDKNVSKIEEMVVVRKYVPIQEKRMVARDILDKCVDDVYGHIVVDEVDVSILFKVAQIKAYTCLEFSEDYDEMIEEYDALCKDKWFYFFDELIGKDVTEFRVVMEREKDAMLSVNSIEAQVAKVAYSLVEAINNFDASKIIPEGTDLNQIMETLNKLK